MKTKFESYKSFLKLFTNELFHLSLHLFQYELFKSEREAKFQSEKINHLTVKRGNAFKSKLSLYQICARNIIRNIIINSKPTVGNMNFIVEYIDICVFYKFIEGMLDLSNVVICWVNVWNCRSMVLMLQNNFLAGFEISFFQSYSTTDLTMAGFTDCLKLFNYCWIVFNWISVKDRCSVFELAGDSFQVAINSILSNIGDGSANIIIQIIFETLNRKDAFYLLDSLPVLYPYLASLEFYKTL
jgi:hypothetical protein